MKKLFFVISLFLLILVDSFSQNTKNNITTGYINTDAGKIYYENAGKGENIVLIHDGILHNEVWDNQFLEFAKNYRVTRYDRRGYGKTPLAKSTYSNVEDLNQIFTQLNINKAALFGMSAGGGLAIDFTLKYPEKVTALVLVGAVVNGYGYTNHMMTRGGRLKSIQDIFSDSTKFIKYFGWDDPYTIYSENIKAKKKYKELLEANPQNVSLAKHRFLKQPDRLAVKFLSEIKVPTLILVGEYDIPDVHAHSGVIETGIAGSKREIILKAGHIVPLEQPEIFNAKCLDFLVCAEFFNLLNSEKYREAIEYYQKKREIEPNITMFTEKEINDLGYKLMQNSKIKDAIEIFKLNTIAYPKSGNVFDSLGEAYMTDGQKELAIKNYEKSLELDPINDNAKTMIKKLKESK